MRVQHVPIELVNQVWSSIEGFLASAAQECVTDDYDLPHIQMCVTTGRWRLIVVQDEQDQFIGAMTVEFYNLPKDRVAFITYIGGRGVADPQGFAQLCTLCKSFGATKIEGAVSAAVARLWSRLGFNEKCRIVEVSLP
jgi:hypothetical protein